MASIKTTEEVTVDIWISRYWPKKKKKKTRKVDTQL